VRPDKPALAAVRFVGVGRQSVPFEVPNQHPRETSMAKPTEEDLFAGTTMTFGEHLEELRGSLFRAIVGLVIGVLIGLLVADRVVKWIQAPLTSALKEHYAITAVSDMQKRSAGQMPRDFATIARDQGLVVEEYYLEKAELARLAGTSEQVADKPSISGPAETMDATTDLTASMVKVRLWRAAKERITALSPQEGFMIWMKAAFVSGIILASPYMFYQIWIFVAAGLYPHEKHFVHLFLPFSILLFIAGAALAFFFAFGPVLKFLFGFNRLMNIDPDLRISEVISFVLVLPLGFGIAFQLPLVMLFLNRIGILSVPTYLEKWRIAILAIFVISMILTPADPISMLLMAVPLTGLYFLGIALCQWLPRNKNPFVEAYDLGA
jgi:sec-independent protein translocase protein TatC